MHECSFVNGVNGPPIKRELRGRRISYVPPLHKPTQAQGEEVKRPPI